MAEAANVGATRDAAVAGGGDPGLSGIFEEDDGLPGSPPPATMA
jgi:hypothetical protein